MKDYFFKSDSDGGLYDTRNPNWSKQPALRPIYQRIYSAIRNTQELRATIREGFFAWPGGYPLYLIGADGGCYCRHCAEKEYRSIAHDWGFFPGTCAVNWEGNALYCDHCGELIESAYGTDGTDGTDRSNEK